VSEYVDGPVTVPDDQVVSRDEMGRGEPENAKPLEPTYKELCSQNVMVEPRSRRIAMARMFLGGKSIVDIARCWNVEPAGVERILRVILRLKVER
jgi:hypothetical protein